MHDLTRKYASGFLQDSGFEQRTVINHISEVCCRSGTFQFPTTELINRFRHIHVPGC